MSSSVTVTDELVAEIANRMAEEGQKVSPLAIWSEVHTGSVVSVAAALRKWREARSSGVPQVAERPALPEAVTDTMRDALDRLWTSAQDEAERAVARRLAGMRQRADDACNERDDALAELQNTVQELETVHGQLDHMADAYQAKADAGARLEEDIALAIQRTDEAETRAQELAARISTLEAELERATSDLAAEREARSQQEANVSNESEAASPSAVADDGTPDGESTGSALNVEHSEEVERLESELEAIRVVLQAEQQEHTARREEATAARAELDAATVELQEAQAQLASLTEARNADASEIARLSASLSEAEERANAAQQHVAELAERATAVSEKPEGTDQASPVGVDTQEFEALKLQISREADAHAAAMSEARENMKKWSEYAKGLKQQLAQANEKMIVVHARGAGEASLSRRLAAELSQLKPEHELLRKDLQQEVIVESISSQLEQQGYSYDAKTGVVSKQNGE
jgi:chromosome segregation ATPase